MSDNINQELLDEVMVPELSDDYFEFDGKRVKIGPLKIKNQKLMAKVIQPVLHSIALKLQETNEYVAYQDATGSLTQRPKWLNDMTISDWLLLTSGGLDAIDALPKAIQILCWDAGFQVTDEEIEESRLQSNDMKAIVLEYLEKSGEVEKQIADFFKGGWQKGQADATMPTPPDSGNTA